MDKIKKFFKLYSLLWLIPFGIFLYWYSIPFFHWLNPTDEITSFSQFQKVIQAIADLFIITGVSFLLMAFAFPSVYRAYKAGFDNMRGHTQLTEWEQRKYRLIVLFGFLFAACILTIASAL